MVPLLNYISCEVAHDQNFASLDDVPQKKEIDP